MSFELQPYNPTKHANAAPQFNQPYVVVGCVPLNMIEFDPRDDEIAELIGPVPEMCPQFDNLGAFSEEPPIPGAAQRQHLSVPCLYRAEVAVDITASPVCVLKINQLGLDIERIPSEWLTDKTIYNKFQCPFRYLGGTVMRRGKRVEIALDAKDPFELPPIESV